MDPNLLSAPTPAPAEPLLLKVADAARLLGIGRTTAYELISRGELPCIRIAETLRVPLDALREYVRRETQWAANPGWQSGGGEAGGEPRYLTLVVRKRA